MLQCADVRHFLCKYQLAGCQGCIEEIQFVTGDVYAIFVYPIMKVSSWSCYRLGTQRCSWFWLPKQLTCCYQSGPCMLLSELYFYWLLLHCSIVSTAQQQLLSSPTWGLLACHAWTLHLETQSSEMQLGYKPLPAYICRRIVLFWSSSLLLYFDHTLQLHLSSAVDGELEAEKASQGHFITSLSYQVPLQMQRNCLFSRNEGMGLQMVATEKPHYTVFTCTINTLA